LLAVSHRSRYTKVQAMDSQLYPIPVTVFFLLYLYSFDRQKLDIAGCPWPVLLCTYFCEKQQATTEQSLDVLPQYVRGNNTVIIMLITFVNLQ